MKTKELYKQLNITYSFYSRFVKRFLDFSISLVGIIVLSPVFLILAVLELIFHGCPILYKQARPGKNRTIFYIYKFRSMNNKKDENGNLLPDAMRITKFGKFIRKTSLDELPQLFNILKGDMSIVGPRPRLVKDMLFYDEDIIKFYVLRPGLTGPTQTTGRNANTWEMVFEKDIAYTHHVTFWNDVKIFIKTFTSVFSSTGETHTNAEEDKVQPKVKEQEYYYADYIRRIGKISTEQYNYGIELSKTLSTGKNYIEYRPEILNQELFDKMNDHKHAILIIKNNNEFLQVFDKNWNCLLFPNLKIKTNPTKDIEEFLSSIFKFDAKKANIKYLTNFVHEKFSQKDKIVKTYNHYFYQIKCNELFEIIKNDKNYCFKSINELENDENVKKFNQDIIDIVKNITK